MLVALVMLIASGAVFILSLQRARQSQFVDEAQPAPTVQPASTAQPARNPWMSLSQLSATALPATLWATLADVPVLGTWDWWSLAVASLCALATATLALALRSRPSRALGLFGALAALPLPGISLVVVGVGSSEIGVAALVVAVAGTVILYAAPPQWTTASIRVMRGGALVLAYASILLIAPELPVHWRPLLTLVPAALAAFNLGALRYFGRGISADIGNNTEHDRELYALWDQRLYASLTPLIAVSSLLILSPATYAETAPWWASGYALALSGAGVALSLWGAGRALRHRRETDPLSIPACALASTHVAALIALGAFSVRRAVAATLHNSEALFGGKIGGADYAIGMIVILAALASLTITSWATRVEGSWQAHLLPVLISGTVSGGTALTAATITNDGLFRTLSFGQHVAFGVLSVLSALSVLAVLVSLRGPAEPSGAHPAMPAAGSLPASSDTSRPAAVRHIFIRALAAGGLGALAALYSFTGGLVTGMDTEIELFVVPLGVTLLVVGLVTVRGEKQWRSWVTLSPALLTLIVVPVLAEIATPTAWRIGLVTVLVVLVLVLGARLSLQAPLVVGSLAALVHAVIAVRTALPDLVIPWWVWLSIAGVILVIIASTYEARLRDARRLGEAVRALR